MGWGRAARLTKVNETFRTDIVPFVRAVDPLLFLGIKIRAKLMREYLPKT